MDLFCLVGKIFIVALNYHNLISLEFSCPFYLIFHLLQFLHLGFYLTVYNFISNFCCLRLFAFECHLNFKNFPQ